jgi:hypothetical protein
MRKMWQGPVIAMNLCFARLARAATFSDMHWEFEKRVNSGKTYGAAIIVAYFDFSCTLLANLKALISEETKLEKINL